MEKVLYKICIIVIIILIIGGVILGYSMYNKMFPMAPDIVIPGDDEIFEIAISGSYGDKVFLDDKDEDKIISLMRSCQPTRKWTINDYPTAEYYYIVTVYTSEDGDGYRYFVYEEDGRVYLELPYHGVYTVDKEILDFIKRYII